MATPLSPGTTPVLLPSLDPRVERQPLSQWRTMLHHAVEVEVRHGGEGAEALNPLEKELFNYGTVF